MPWYTNPAILGLAAGALGAYGASQNNSGSSSESSGSREPWQPARQDLLDILGIGREVFEHQRDFRPPPPLRSGGGESRSALRELAQEAHRRAMESDFVPRAQEMALGLAAGNPLIHRTWERAAQFRPPSQSASMAYNAPLQEILRNLMAGQTELGQLPFRAPARLPSALPFPLPRVLDGSVASLPRVLDGSVASLPSRPALMPQLSGATYGTITKPGSFHAPPPVIDIYRPTPTS